MLNQDDSKTLRLAVLAQSLYDILLSETSEEDYEESDALWTAYTHLSFYPTLSRKLRLLTREEKAEWLRKLEEVIYE